MADPRYHDTTGTALWPHPSQNEVKCDRSASWDCAPPPHMLASCHLFLAVTTAATRRPHPANFFFWGVGGLFGSCGALAVVLQLGMSGHIKPPEVRLSCLSARLPLLGWSTASVYRYPCRDGTSSPPPPRFIMSLGSTDCRLSSAVLTD